MAYDKAEAAEEVKVFKRTDPRPILRHLGWTQKDGKAKDRYINEHGAELDLWGGSKPGDFFAFSTPGVRSRPKSVLDLAMDKCGGGTASYKPACDLLRQLFGPAPSLSKWDEGTSAPSLGDEYSGVMITEQNAARLRVSPDGYLRIPMSTVTDAGLKVAGYTDLGSEAGDSGRVGIWSTASSTAGGVIVVYPELRDALNGAYGSGMSLWSPRGADRSAVALVKLALAKLDADTRVIVAAPDTAEGDARRADIRKALGDAGVSTLGFILGSTL
ncbi:hypothetical protein PARHAE_03264 [Paracoccus haematequi]|uniref:Uncharacterized protein n=1 Tax=Paracoccus haematequi TaxID=2491866 RepID=A0A447IRD1_9RHOB|nr:hypothetical protein [Paracoccus haematequi]VDS10053.1 hypothetical protein PARHAE_03264 [Paracoccus haematequi]